MRVRAARGAITVDRDDRSLIVAAGERLLRELIEANGIDRDDLVSVVFTGTGDLRSAFPAEAVRSAGLDDVPVLSAREMDVDGALERVIRVLVHFHSERSEVRHVYLEGARALRPDRDARP